MLVKVTICLLAISSLACAEPQSRGRSEEQFSTPSSKSAPVTPVPILRQINEILEDGSYRFGYEAGDGTFRIETRQQDGTVQGKYGFRDSDGQIRVVDYSATNETGFDAKGEHIPKGPPPARARPDDFQDEIDYDEFTTPRPRTRPPTRPTTPRTRPTRPPTTKPRRRPTARPVQKFVDDDFDITEQHLEEDNQAFLQQGFQQSASHRPRPGVPRRQQTVRPTSSSADHLFLDPIPASPPRSPTPVHQSGSGRAIARPASSFEGLASARPQRPLRPQTQRTPTLEEFLDRPTNRPTAAPVRTLRPQQDLFESLGHQENTEEEFRTSIAFNTPRRVPQRVHQTIPQTVQQRPSVLDDFQSKPRRPQTSRPLHSTAAATSGFKTEFPKTRRPQPSQFNEFETQVAPTSRRPQTPSVQVVFDDFQTESAPAAPKTRRPQQIRRPQTSQVFTQDAFPEDFPTQVGVPQFSRPVAVSHEIIPDLRFQQQRPPIQRPSSGSVIDDFIATVQREPPRPVAINRPRPTFDFEEDRRLREARQRPPLQFRAEELSGVLGRTHGFVLQQRPVSHHNFRGVNEPFVESAHLTQTVPGAPNPIVHNF